jgi:hypothetical protein
MHASAGNLHWLKSLTGMRKLGGHSLLRRKRKTDDHFENVGQHTQKRLPRISWRRLQNADRAGLAMLGLFFGTLIVLAAFIFVASSHIQF